MTRLFDADELYELEQERRNKCKERCQCQTDFGTCPGVRNCPYSDYQEGEEE